LRFPGLRIRFGAAELERFGVDFWGKGLENVRKRGKNGCFFVYFLVNASGRKIFILCWLCVAGG
jgi:hypothetical protein